MKKKKLLTLSITLLFAGFIAVTTVFLNILRVDANSIDYIGTELQSEPVTSMQSYIENMSTRQALEKIVKQEQYLKNFLTQNRSLEEKSKLFAVFYRNILSFSNKINNDISGDFSAFDIEKPFYVLGIKITPTNKDDVVFKVIEPKTDFITTVINCGYFFEPNYVYINDTYSKYLDTPSREYLNFKKQEQILRDNRALFIDNARNPNITRNYLMNSLIFLRNLVYRYPNSALSDEELGDIKKYTNEFITIYNYDKDTPEQIASAYQQFLNNAPPNTFEYNTLEYFYNLFKKKDGLSEYDSAQYEWFDKNFYKGQPIIYESETNYLRLKFDKNKLLQAYKEAEQCCTVQMYERNDKNRYSNQYAICIREELKMGNPDNKRVFDTFRNYCSVITNGDKTKIGSCIIKEFEKLKQ